MGGNIDITNCKFMFNMISYKTDCSETYNSDLLIKSHDSLKMMIHDSLFYHNENSNTEVTDSAGLFLHVCENDVVALSISVHNTHFVSNSFLSAVRINDTAMNSKITFNKVNISNNGLGIYIFVNGKKDNHLVNVISSHFKSNSFRALTLNYISVGNVSMHLYNTTFVNNKGSSENHDSVLYIITGNDSIINISECNFYENMGGDNIVHIDSFAEFDFPLIFSNVLINSSNFMSNKIGSVLKIAKCFLKFYFSTIFQHNLARIGAAIHLTEGSQIVVDDGATVLFNNNTALLRGGAIYIDLTACYNHGIVFTNSTRYDAVSFVDNSAKLSGNSIYFNIPDSCGVIRDHTKSDSPSYIPYKFNYTQTHDIVGPAVAASPYQMKICSPKKCKCTDATDYPNNECRINRNVMLGQPIYFNTTICDYFNAANEALPFQIQCINCKSKFRLLDNEILIQNELRGSITLVSVGANTDLQNDTDVTLNISSILSPEYRQLTATLSLKLSSCYNGFLFSKESQQCECYNKDGYLQCEGETVSVKLGYWFGDFSGKQTFSLCDKDYCNFFTHRKETRSGFFDLPEEIDGQCSLHRTGVACGECREGYTLAYNSPDCISIDKCSPGIIVLVIILTALYWIAIVIILFGMAYIFNTKQVSPGYLYGIVYFYSIVDILLATNFHKANEVFYTAVILSSFVKLNPQFLGRLCFIKKLDAVDQQFIHYCHVVFVSVILAIIIIIAKCSKKITFYVNRYMVRVVSLVLLFSYTSLTSISLLLLRPIKYDGIDGFYTYLSPHLKYYAHQHAIYASVAIFCVLFVTIGIPLLLVVEPLLMKYKHHIPGYMKKWDCFIRIKLLLNQLQDCYKDQYRWFAGYYLLCRLVILLITYFANNNYNNMIYYLQTACVIIVMTHILIQPYKKDILNILDAIILLIMLLIVNLSTFNFSTSTISGVALSLIIAPLVLLFAVGIKKLLASKIKMLQLIIMEAILILI